TLRPAGPTRRRRCSAAPAGGWPHSARRTGGGTSSTARRVSPTMTAVDRRPARRAAGNSWRLPTSRRPRRRARTPTRVVSPAGYADRRVASTSPTVPHGYAHPRRRSHSTPRRRHAILASGALLFWWCLLVTHTFPGRRSPLHATRRETQNNPALRS